jgi:HK97 family phage portal protein
MKSPAKLFNSFRNWWHQPNDRYVVVNPMSAGVYVDERTALTYSVVWACIHYIAMLSVLPLDLIEESADGRKTRLENDLHWLIQRQANPQMTAFAFRELMVHHVAIYGNGYAEIERNGRGEPVALWPLDPTMIEPKLDDKERLYYEIISGDSRGLKIQPREVLHFKGLGFDGYRGYGVIAYAAKSIGLGLAAESEGLNFFANGSQPGGLLKTESFLKPEQKKQWAEEWTERFTKGGKYKIAILDGKADWKQTTIPHDQAQFLETRTFQIPEICRWFRVPPHKVQHLDNAHYNSVEQQAIEAVTDCLVPWAKRFESEFDNKLFGVKQQGRLYTKHNFYALLRGDTKTQSEHFKAMLNAGVYSINDVRELMDMNRIGPEGDQRYIQINMTTLDAILAEKNLKSEPQQSKEDDRDIESQSRNGVNGHGKILALDDTGKTGAIASESDRFAGIG